MRIATLNLWGHFGDTDARMERLARAWSRIDADVLLCQEVPSAAVSERVAAIAGLEHLEALAAAGEAISIAARTPLTDLVRVPLSASHPPRAALVAHTQGVQIVCAHTAFRPAEMVTAHLAEVCALAQGPCVLGGDLNAEPAVVMPHARAAGLIDPHADLPHTWPTHEAYFRRAWTEHTGRAVDFPVAPRRLDYLLVAGLTVTAAGHDTLVAPAGPVSDHACVWIDIIPPHAE